jgi:hypothetical protein
LVTDKIPASRIQGKTPGSMERQRASTKTAEVTRVTVGSANLCVELEIFVLTKRRTYKSFIMWSRYGSPCRKILLEVERTSAVLHHQQVNLLSSSKSIIFWLSALPNEYWTNWPAFINSCNMKGVGADIFEYSTTVNSLVDVNRIVLFGNYKTFWKAVKYQ